MQERSQEFSKGGARQRENLSALRIILQPCNPLQPFFSPRGVLVPLGNPPPLATPLQ